MFGIDYARRGVAEFIGAFALTFVGAGSAIYQNNVDSALAHGLVIAVFVSAFGHISGGHFNPAVTLGFLVTRRISAKMAGFYWFVQLAGATVAALLLKWVLLGSLFNSLHLGAPAIGSTTSQAGKTTMLVTTGQAVMIEAILTFFLVIVVFATAVDPGGAFSKIAGLAIGLTITLDILMAGSLTGGVMNPSRAFGPELVSNHWTNAWVWYVGPLAGGAIAALLYEMLYLTGPTPDESEPEAVALGDAPATDAAA